MMRLRLVLLLGVLMGAASPILAASYSVTPDTVYFTPTNGQTTVTAYVRVQYAGDTTMPGTHIHASITSGSSYFSTSHDTVYTRSYRYWTVTYTVQSSSVIGAITFSDDTTTHTVVLIGRAGADGELAAVGPYFLTTPKNGHGCEYLRLINNGSDADTITELVWSHGPAPLFSYDTTLSLPHVIAAHDTLHWTICFSAPNDTLVHLDTLIVRYHDAYSASRSVSRVVYAKAVDTTYPDAGLQGIGPYWTSSVVEGAASCQNLRLINNGSDADTVWNLSWTHDPEGLFSYDTTVSLPIVLQPRDTLNWSICFHAPSDSLVRTDTLVIWYRDSYSQERFLRRVATAHATDTSLHECYLLYPVIPEVTEVGDTSRFRLYIINRLDSTVQLSALHISGSSATSFFVDSSTFPRTIAGHHYDSLWLRFAPHGTSESTYSATIMGSFSSNDTTHCRTATASITGHSALAARDTESVSLSDTSTRHVALTNDSTSLFYSHRIDIVNSIGVRIRIDTVYLTGSSHMYIAQNIHSVFPDTLANGAKHSVIVHFYGDSSHTIYHDTLTVILENALLPFYVYLDGYTNGPNAAVQNWVATTGANLQVYPNPSESVVTIQPQGLLNAECEILDVLGHRVVRLSRSESAWAYDVSTLPAGHYFARVTGVDILGHEAIITRSIEVARR